MRCQNIKSQKLVGWSRAVVVVLLCTAVRQTPTCRGGPILMDTSGLQVRAWPALAYQKFLNCAQPPTTSQRYPRAASWQVQQLPYHRVRPLRPAI